jgi:hypothetical protein
MGRVSWKGTTVVAPGRTMVCTTWGVNVVPAGIDGLLMDPWLLKKLLAWVV